MSVNQYVYHSISGDWVFDFDEEIISCSPLVSTLTIQELINACRKAECSDLGISYLKICDAGGKNYLDTDAGIQVGITVQLLGNWVIYSEKDSGVFRVLGGNLVQVGGGDPFAPNPDITYVNILSAASTVVSVSSGSGLSTEEHNKLMSVPSTTLEQEEKDTINLTSEITQMIAANQVMLADLKKLLFERQNTIQNKKITSYIAGEDTTVNVTYNSDGVPISETIDDN